MPVSKRKEEQGKTLIGERSLAMCENGKKCIGVDVGGTSVKIGLFETDGTLRFKWEVPTRKEVKS